MKLHLKHPLVVGCIFAVVVTILVMISLPKKQPNEERSTFKILCKAFFLSLVVSCAVAYILHDNEFNNMMTNIIKGDPDF